VGKHPAQQLMKARILLKADASEAGEGCSDSQIARALNTRLFNAAGSAGLSPRYNNSRPKRSG
jgi:hypothetical protein